MKIKTEIKQCIYLLNFVQYRFFNKIDGLFNENHLMNEGLYIYNNKLIIFLQDAIKI